MPSSPATPACTKREFMAYAFVAVRAASHDVCKIWVDHHVLTKLFRNMAITVPMKERLPEALAVMMHTIATRTTERTVSYAQVEDIIEDTSSPVGGADEHEWDTGAPLVGVPTYGIQKILDTFRCGGKQFCLIDWEPTEEPAGNIPSGLLAQFRKQRRAIVERAYIEAEANEA